MRTKWIPKPPTGLCSAAEKAFTSATAPCLMLTPFLHCLERRQSYEEFSVASLLAAFEAAAEPPERSVVEIEPALVKRSRINPFPA